MANGTLMPSPVFTGLDATGTPLSGGKLYAYIAGTTTPQATYSDVGLTVPNANPVILNSAGRATVYLTPGASYKLVLKSSVDVTQWTADNVSAVPTSTAALDIAATAGEDLTERNVVYLADGTGGTTAGRWYRANASAPGTSTLSKMLGVVVSSVLTGQSGSVRVGGSMTGFGGLTPGAAYYVSTVAGALTASAPTNARIVGVADSTTSVVLDMHSTVGPLVVGGNAAIGGTLVVTGDTTLSGALAVTGNSSFTGTMTMGALSLTGGAVVTRTDSGTVNDLATGLTFRPGMEVVLRMNNATAVTIQGIASGVDGAQLTIVSVGAGQVNLAHQNVSSGAGNRMVNTITSSTTPLAAGSGYATYSYDGTAQRWRLIRHEQGAWITYTPTLSNITLGNGTLSGRYWVRGLDVRVEIVLTAGSTTTFAASPFAWTVPYAAGAVTNFTLSTAIGYHSGTGNSAGVCTVANGTSTLKVQRVTDLETSNGWDSSTPWVWGAGDQMSLLSIYLTT